jgi:hypothetical protein
MNTVKNIHFLSFFIIFFIIGGCSQNSASNVTGFKELTNVVFILPDDTVNLSVFEKNDLHSLQHVLKVSGITFSEISVEEIMTARLSNYSIIVVPFASAKYLTDFAVLNHVMSAVKVGSNILTDGLSDIDVSLGLKLQSKQLNISTIGDSFFSNDTLFWTTPHDCYVFDNSIRKDSVLAFEKKSQQPIAISGTFGKGHFISISTLFDPNTTKGYSRFPFLIEWMDRFLGLQRIAERKSVEMYFDPGMREDNLNIDSLAELWRERLIKRVYIAGWYYDNNVDYTPILNACHRNGIQAYCWLETPEINKTFWDKHPEWREKTATGRDANIDWRKLMNLADTACRKQVCNELDSFLMKHDWDGVNLAELYFEPHPQGFDNPDNFTPMNTIVRKEFKQKNGFDPIELFNQKSANYWKTNKKSWRLFADYRKDLSYRLKSDFLAFLNTVKQRKTGFDVMLTGIDVSLQPAEADNIGESTEFTLALYKKFNITLQIEDPSNCWGSGPERYAELGTLYRKTVKDENRLVFDCNVVGSHEKGYGGFPSEKPSGEEIRQIAYNMSVHNVRPAFYAEDGVSLIDFKNISTVLASKAMISYENTNEWSITSPYTILVTTGSKNCSLLLDGKPWLTGKNGKILIPKGKHILRCDTIHSPINAISLLAISGELETALFSKNKLEFSYSEDVTSCYAITDKKPKTIIIDGKETKCLISEGKEFVLKLPQGKHSVTIESF